MPETDKLSHQDLIDSLYKRGAFLETHFTFDSKKILQYLIKDLIVSKKLDQIYDSFEDIETFSNIPDSLRSAIQKPSKINGYAKRACM